MNLHATIGWLQTQFISKTMYVANNIYEPGGFVPNGRNNICYQYIYTDTKKKAEI